METSRRLAFDGRRASRKPTSRRRSHPSEACPTTSWLFGRRHSALSPLTSLHASYVTLVTMLQSVLPCVSLGYCVVQASIVPSLSLTPSAGAGAGSSASESKLEAASEAEEKAGSSDPTPPLLAASQLLFQLHRLLRLGQSAAAQQKLPYFAEADFEVSAVVVVRW